MRIALRLASLPAALVLLSGPALAQSVLPSPSMPMPPSARDPAPRTEPSRKRAAKPAAEADRTRPAPARETRGSDYRERIDTRPVQSDQRRAIQLEDDPRAVAPVMQNGRPGVGMRF